VGASIEEMGRTTADARRLLQARAPVLVRGAVKDWRAVSAWSFEYLRDRLASTILEVEAYDVVAARLEPLELRRMTFGDYYARLKSVSTERLFIAETDITRSVPSILNDIEVPELIPTTESSRSLLFCGVDSLTPLHYHEAEHALLCQVRGTKRLLLSSPRKTRVMRPHRWYSLRRNFSRLSVEAWANSGSIGLDLAAAEPLECVLQPGDALFIPVHWWHAARGIDASISVTFFWPAARSHWAFPTPGVRTFWGSKSERLLRLFGRTLSSTRTIRLASCIARWVGIVDDAAALEADLKKGRI